MSSRWLRFAIVFAIIAIIAAISTPRVAYLEAITTHRCLILLLALLGIIAKLPNTSVTACQRSSYGIWSSGTSRIG
jgi:hypothetical protein